MTRGTVLLQDPVVEKPLVELRCLLFCCSFTFNDSSGAEP